MEDLTANHKKPHRHTAVALGLFDGLHRGHRAVIEKLQDFNSELSAAVFTFTTESIRNKHNNALQYIFSNEEKLKMLEYMGIEYIYCPQFEDLKNVSAETFIINIICERLSAKAVVCGEDFRFGVNAECGVKELKEYGEKYGFSVTEIASVLENGEIISSTEIRKGIEAGSIEKVNELLGYEYFIAGIIQYGNQIGRTLNFPTINQYFGENQILPRFGVYISKTIINGKEYKSVTSIGVKPTIETNSRPLAETHILDYNDDLYGQEITVALIKFIRPELTFNSLGELKEGIANDINIAKNYFDNQLNRGDFYG